VLVFSHDAALAKVVRAVAVGRYPIRIINEWNDLLRQVGSGSARIVLLDVDALSTEVDSALAELNRVADWLVIVIAAKQQQAQDFMRFWSERRIHRLLIKPAAAGITRLLLESAFARFIELRELHENTDSMEVPAELLAAEASVERRRIKPSMAAAAAFGVIAAAAALWWMTEPFGGGASEYAAGDSSGSALTRTDGPSPRPRADGSGDGAFGSSVEAAADKAPDDFEDLLQLARVAESRGRISAPLDDNAVDYYRSILVQSPDHSVARERLNALLEGLFAEAQSQILDHDFAAAEQTLEQIRRGDPPGTRLSFLLEQLTAMKAADAARGDAGSTAAVSASDKAIADDAGAADASELQSMLTLAELRLDEGLLVEPAGDSARDYLLRAVDLGVEESSLQGYAQEFAEQAAGAIPNLLERGDFSGARSMLDTAKALGADTKDLEGFEAPLAAGLSEQARAADELLHAQALSRIESADFVGSEDAAVGLLDQLRSRNADPALIGDVEARLTNTLALDVREDIAAQRWDQAETSLEVFAVAGLEPAAANGLKRDLTIARRQQQFLEDTAPAGELQVAKSAPAEYPRAARVAGVSGWVDLHFTVDTHGATKDIEVIAAEPVGRFENAATAALAEYEFVPFELDDVVYERRLRLRMRFELN
jgi:TonB family protein